MKVQIIGIPLLVVGLVLLVGIGTGACGGEVGEEVAPAPGEAEAEVPALGEEEEEVPALGEEEAEAEVVGKPHFTSDDGRIEFALDNVERTKVWPAELRGGRTPKEGYDFVIVDVTIVRITDGHADARFDSTIIANNGAEYNESGWKWTGWKFYDPQDITSETELLEGAQGTLIFELPEDVKPVKVRLAYVFFQSWSESGQHEYDEEKYIDIILP